MKKIVILMLIIISLIQIYGCNNSFYAQITNNISELQEQYFYFENNDYAISLISGKRENDYCPDGKSGNLKDYCVLMIEQTNFKQLESIKIFINEKELNATLLLNPYNNNYVYDFEINLLSTDIIKVELFEKMFELENKTVNFKLSALDTLKLTIKQNKKYIKSLFKNDIFNGEVFIRIIKIKGYNLFVYQILFVDENHNTMQYLINPITKKILHQTY